MYALHTMSIAHTCSWLDAEHLSNDSGSTKPNTGFFHVVKSENPTESGIRPKKLNQSGNKRPLRSNSRTIIRAASSAVS